MPEKPKHAKYYEGVLQLRNPTEEVLDFVESKISKTKVFVAKVVKHKTGVDLHLSSQRFLRALGKKLQEKFGGVLKTTRKLHTVSKATGKKLYRVTVLFRTLPFKKNDRVTYHGSEWIVLRAGAQAHLKNVKTGKKIRVRAEELLR